MLKIGAQNSLRYCFELEPEKVCDIFSNWSPKKFAIFFRSGPQKSLRYFLELSWKKVCHDRGDDKLFWGVGPISEFDLSHQKSLLYFFELEPKKVCYIFWN